MRAICEACGHVQPPDWKPGDLCGHCGAVVRREKRCHWCVQLTPDGKYCRHCGAGLVPDERYGAARWLKHLGMDQFVIPERLAAMDPEQAEHFTRLYQRHAAVAERHLDDLALAESFGRQRGWTRALEAELLPRLPLADDELRALTPPVLRGTTDAEKLLEIREASPFETTRQLAALARLRLWQSGPEALYPAFGADLEMALPALGSPDAALRVEAALVLSHWRLVVSGGLFGKPAIVDALQAPNAFPVESAVALALIRARQQNVGQPVPAAALASEDADVAFAAALANYFPDPLLAALRVPVRRFAAAHALTKMNLDFALAPCLPDFDADQLEDILSTLTWQARPRPDLRPFLAEAAGNAALSSSARANVRELLRLDLRPGDADRLVRETPDPGHIAKVLQSPTLEQGEVLKVCHTLVELNLFSPAKIGALTQLIEANRLPLDFLTQHFRTAPDASLQGLRTLAQHHLAGTGALALHGFLRNVLWDEAAPVATREQASHLLQNWYGGDYGERPPLQFTEPAARTYFGSFGAYVEEFVRLLERLPVLIGLNVESAFLRPLETAARPADPAALIAALAALPTALLARLRAGLVALARDYDGWSLPREWAVLVLGHLLRHPRWRADARADLLTLRNCEPVDYLVETLLAE